MAEAGLLVEVQKLKTEGNQLFVSKEWFPAIEEYTKAIDAIIQYSINMEEEEEGPRVVELTEEDIQKLTLEEEKQKGEEIYISKQHLQLLNH